MTYLEKRILIVIGMFAVLATLALCTSARADDYGGLPDGAGTGSALDSATAIAIHFCGADWPDIKSAAQAKCFVAARDAAMQSYRRTLERYPSCDTDTECFNRHDRPAIRAGQKAAKCAAGGGK